MTGCLGRFSFTSKWRDTVKRFTSHGLRFTPTLVFVDWIRWTFPGLWFHRWENPRPENDSFSIFCSCTLINDSFCSSETVKQWSMICKLDGKTTNKKWRHVFLVSSISLSHGNCLTFVFYLRFEYIGHQLPLQASSNRIQTRILLSATSRTKRHQQRVCSFILVALGGLVSFGSKLESLFQDE